MAHPVDLNRLEILALEFDYPKKTPGDFDTLKYYWIKWFTEMKVTKHRIAKTDLPVHTERIIKDFLNDTSGAQPNTVGSTGL